MVSEPPWVAQNSGTEARNGTTSHTINFGFTSTTNNFLVFVIHGAVTHTVSGWTERLQPVGSGELSVFTKTSAAESSITVTHNGSDYPVAWSAYEFPSGTTWVAGVDNSQNSDAFPQLTGLPGTEVVVFGGRGRAAAAADSPTGASSTVSDPWVEDADQFAAENNVTDGCYLYVTHQINVTATSITPTATTTYTGSWGAIPDRQHVTFALDVPAAVVADTIAGPYAGPAPGRISPTGRFAPWTGVADQPIADVAAQAENASSTGTANDATAALGINAEAATGTSTANDPTPALGAVAEAPVATGSAPDPTAALAVNADAATAAAAGQDPTTAITVNAEAATATATAFDATVSTVPVVNAPAELAAVSGTAGDATAALGASAEAATSSGAAFDTSVSLAVLVELAAVSAAAFDATVQVGGPGNALAECATATAGAFDARVQKLILRPNTGTVSRPDTGRITRPFTGTVQRP